MKRILLILVAFSLTLDYVVAQLPAVSGKDANLVLFGGRYALKQNANNNGGWWGAYGDLPIYKSPAETFSLGLWGLYSRSFWTDNLAPYSSKSDNFSFGLNFGLYEENFTFSHALFTGLALGYGHASEKATVEKKLYRSQSVQDDHLFVGNLNLNLMKIAGYHPYLFPRTQLIISVQQPISSTKQSIVNGKYGTSESWDKSVYELMLKQSLWDIRMNAQETVWLQPKIGYQHSQYYGPNANALMFELALHKIYNDDFFTITVMQKFYGPHKGAPAKDLYMIMASLNFVALFRPTY